MNSRMGVVEYSVKQGKMFLNLISRAPFQPTSTTPTSLRLYELDGIRGWAALSVVAFHIFWETFGIIMPSIRNPVTAFLLDGALAVAVFFVLSGEALSAAYFSGKGELAVVKLAAKRYSRLTIPISAVCLSVFILIKLNAVHIAQTAQILHRQDWIGSWLQFPITPKYFLKYTLMSVYGSVLPKYAVDPFLWTMKYEMQGSIIVFAVLLSFRYVRFPWLMLFFIAFFLLLMPTLAYIGCFLFGIIFASVRKTGFFAKMQAFKYSGIVSSIFLLTLALADGFSIWKNHDLKHIPHAAILAVPLLFAVYCNTKLCNFFSNRFSRFLGDLSFPLYLVQFPVIISLTSALIILSAAHSALNPVLILSIGSTSLIACLLSAYLFAPIEILTRYIGNQITRFIVVR